MGGMRFFGPAGPNLSPAEWERLKRGHWRLCLRQDESVVPHVPSSTVVACRDCGAGCWYDPAASVYAPGEYIICQFCLQAYLESDRANPWEET